MKIKKILLPVDFSERTGAAARHAAAFADRSGASLTALHVLNSFEYGMHGPEIPGDALLRWREANREHIERQMTAFLAEHLPGREVSRVIVEGDPAREVVHLAHEEKFDLIVIPTHGYGPFRRFVLGSVTTKVLHDADCAVLTGAHLAETPAPRPSNVDHVICAVDFGRQTEKILTWASSLAREFGARVTAVHALPPDDAGQARYFDQAWRASLAERAEEAFDKLRKEMNLQADMVIRSGPVQDVIRDAAESLGADMVVIGRHADTGILGRLRAHSYAIVRESPVPVLSV